MCIIVTLESIENSCCLTNLCVWLIYDVTFNYHANLDTVELDHRIYRPSSWFKDNSSLYCENQYITNNRFSCFKSGCKQYLSVICIFNLGKLFHGKRVK